MTGEGLVETDAELAARLATQAGHLLVAVRDELTQAGAPAWHVMDDGDLASHRFLADELAKAMAVVSGEADIYVHDGGM